MEIWEHKIDPSITVEAVLLNEDNAETLAQWCRGELVEEIDPQHPNEIDKQPGINVPTQLGNRRASLGMYIGKYANGHFFVAYLRRFEEVYTPQNRPSPPPESSGDTRLRLGFGDTPSAGARKI